MSNIIKEGSPRRRYREAMRFWEMGCDIELFNRGGIEAFKGDIVPAFPQPSVESFRRQPPSFRKTPTVTVYERPPQEPVASAQESLWSGVRRGFGRVGSFLGIKTFGK